MDELIVHGARVARFNFHFGSEKKKERFIYLYSFFLLEFNSFFRLFVTFALLIFNSFKFVIRFFVIFREYLWF